MPVNNALTVNLGYPLVYIFFLAFKKTYWKRERAGCFTFIVFSMSCYCECPVTLSHGAVGWSAVCDCGIS